MTYIKEHDQLIPGGRNTTETATFAAGCFWGVEEAFSKVKGVVRTTVGYTGGSKEYPIYSEVCSGDTHHAEAVLVEYDAAQVSYEDLLNVFWRIHDPTTLNRQGPDVGEQYRSAIFYHDARQRDLANRSRDTLHETDQFRRRKIVTQIVPASAFWKAEDYHQHYLQKRGMPKCGIC